MNSTLDLFTSVSIHGLASDENGDSRPLSLKRSISFPCPTWTGGYNSPRGDIPFHPSLASRPIPKGGYHLDVRVSSSVAGEHFMGYESFEAVQVDGLLGEGRSAFVLSLDVIDVGVLRDPASNLGGGRGLESKGMRDKIKQALPKLCIKLAKPTYSRSLAREAWYYEHFERTGALNVVVPRHYGIFCAENLNVGSPHLQVDFIPQYDSLVDHLFSAHAAEDEGEDEGRHLLPEETGEFTCLDDEKSSVKSSPWYPAHETKERPCVTVLLMEQLGEPLTPSEFHRDKAELDDIFDDLCNAKVIHGDLRFPNLLKAPMDAAICASHNRPHGWFWVDWEDARIAHHAEALRMIRVSKRDLSFWMHGGRE
ncbi:hypothetical protein BKA70DRAFT_1196614 [Coprinopsis sp. MPI-PUGE-AT-0042]|nr:hypothetical protein BKA70DRAFT_1196614 [Coprinopsis sp. MPI-PUGE-AT-0042]